MLAPLLLALAFAAAPAAPLAVEVPGGVGEYRWAPDGALLVLAEVDPACGADLAYNERADAAAQGRPHTSDRLLVFPDENHWVLKPRNTRVFYEEVFGWIERHLASPNTAPAAPPTTP